MLKYSSFLGVAQFGSVPEWGSGGRKFKSSHPDHRTTAVLTYGGFFIDAIYVA